MQEWHNIGYFDCADYTANCTGSTNPLRWDVLWHCPEFAILGTSEGGYNLLIREGSGMWMLTLPPHRKGLLAFLRDAWQRGGITDDDWRQLRASIAAHARGRVS
jgi:hypothetical protein